MSGELPPPPPVDSRAATRALRLVLEVGLNPDDSPSRQEAATILTDALGSAAMTEVQESVRLVTYGPGKFPIDGTLKMPFPEDGVSRLHWRMSESDQAVAERFGLSPREMQVVDLLKHGLSNRQIAGEMYLSEDTVKTHLRRAYGKLHANDRAHAVAIVNGIVPQPPKRRPR